MLPLGGVGSSSSMVSMADINRLSTYCLNSPANPQELFNLHHASARNIIKWIFGTLKQCFKILTVMPECSMKTQTHIPLALAAIHNFIWSSNDDEIENSISQVYDPQPGVLGELVVGPPQTTEQICAQEKWDEIAVAMWEQYQALLQAPPSSPIMTSISDSSPRSSHSQLSRKRKFSD